MTFQERTRLILQFDELIRRKYKADALGYAKKLGISRGSFFRLLSSMREEFQAPIRYEKSNQCYGYSRSGRMHFGFLEEPAEQHEVPVAPPKVNPVAEVVNQYLHRAGSHKDGAHL